MYPKDADIMANSVDPDQTVPLGAVWSGTTVFAQACLSKNFGTLRHFISGQSSLKGKDHKNTLDFNLV